MLYIFTLSSEIRRSPFFKDIPRLAEMKFVRNFCIIAHIDHGKSTLADRFLELTNTIDKIKMQEQVLDDMDLERERGITIKSHPIRMIHKAQDGNQYILNLIDTPGHVDFTYEVSKSLNACEGAILVVDATQGIEAQTLTNIYLALEQNLTIVPVINKIDLPSAHPDQIRRQIADLLGIDPATILPCSAKTGLGVAEIIERVILDVPPPQGTKDAPLRALVFNSIYDSFRGVVAYVRIVDGALKRGTTVRFMSNGMEHEATELGYFKPNR